MKKSASSLMAFLVAVLVSTGVFAQPRRGQPDRVLKPLHEVNQVAQPDANHVVAIVGATLIDGRGGAPVLDAVVVIRGEKIVAVGKRSAVTIPAGAEVIDAKGLTLLPGLIDSHFHIDGDDPLPALYLTHGITSVRDPGQWTEAYDVARKMPAPVPRLFLVGEAVDCIPRFFRVSHHVRVGRISGRRRVKMRSAEKQTWHWRRRFSRGIVGFDPLPGIAE